MKPLWQSLLGHLFVVVLAFLFLYLMPTQKLKKPPIRVKIIEKKIIQPTLEQPLPVSTVPTLAKKKSQTAEPRKVFGLSKSTLTSNASDSIGIKSGNTMATEVDQTPLQNSDANSLPTPTEEYLVTTMPKLKSEIRIPYPPEARQKNIEGLVLLEILVDERGIVRDARVLEGPGYGLNEAALASIYKFEFSPAYIDEKPVTVRIRYGYRFVLN